MPKSTKLFSIFLLLLVFSAKTSLALTTSSENCLGKSSLKDNGLELDIKCSAATPTVRLQVGRSKLANHQIRSDRIYTPPTQILMIVSKAEPENGLTKSRKTYSSSIMGIFKDIYQVIGSNWFVVAELLLICLSYSKPHLFRTGGFFKPEFFVSKVGVFMIFLFNGLYISLDQFKQATASWKINLLTQTWSMLVLPMCTYFACKLPAIQANVGIRDGLLVLSALPTTINMCIMLTSQSGGDTASSILHAVLGNIIGVFLTPFIVFKLVPMGSQGGIGDSGVSFLSILIKLSKLTILPMIMGQILRRNAQVIQLAKKFRPQTKLFAETVLLALIFNTFCDTFSRKISNEQMSPLVGSLFLALPSAFLLSNIMFWMTSSWLMPRLNVKSRCSAMMCSSQKTLAFGIPFIKSCFGDRPDLALVLTPLLVFSPLQLMSSSSFLVPSMKRIIQLEGGGTGKGDGVTKGEGGGQGTGRKSLFKRVTLGRIKSQLRTSLSWLAAICVLFELFEEIVADVPLIQHLVGKMKVRVHHGVLLLTLQHLIHATDDALAKAEEKKKEMETAEKNAAIKQWLKTVYKTEQEAALAYDQAALLLFGYSSHLNFPPAAVIPLSHLIQVSQPSSLPKPARSSRYRGVIWNERMRAWQVSPIALGYESEVEGEDDLY